MKVHITRICGRMGTSAIAQKMVTQIGREMGFHEIGIYNLDFDGVSDEAMRTRQSGSISAVEPGDIVIFQTPSWNGNRYDASLIRRIRSFPNTKVAVMVHDDRSMLDNFGEEYLQETIAGVYNQADILTVPSKRMLDYFLAHGMQPKKAVIQKMFDYPLANELNTPKFRRQVFFSGGVLRFGFLQEWHCKTRMILYSATPAPAGTNIENRGYVHDLELLSAYTEGGFGLVWPDDKSGDYYRYILPFKLSTYLAAGIPVIIKAGLTPTDFVVRNGIGYAVDSFEEIDEVVQKCTELDYNRMVDHSRRISFLVRNGYFTRRLFNDVVTQLLTE